MVFDTHNVQWLNGQTVFDQTSEKSEPRQRFLPITAENYNVSSSHVQNSVSDWLLFSALARLVGRGA